MAPDQKVVSTWPDGPRARPRPLPAWRGSHGLRALVVALLSIVVIVTVVSAVRQDGGADNMHILQAQAFLRGTLELSRPVEDVALFQGKTYSPYPPAPAILLLPLVAVFGVDGPLPTVLALVLTGLGVWSAYRICTRVGVTGRSAHVLVAGLFLGTAYWSAVLLSSTVWYLSHVVAVTALLVAFDQALRGRATAAGLLLGVAVLSRQFTVFAAPMLLAVLLDNPPTDNPPTDNPPGRGRQVLRSAAFALPLSAFLGGYLAFNAARFSGPFDTGYAYLPLTGFLQERVAENGLFSLSYVPFNTVYLLLQGFSVRYSGPQLLSPQGMDPFGTSLLMASPFLVFAALARSRRRTLLVAWACVLLVVAGELLYYNNGFAQTNAQRFSLDFVPMLFVLLCWGVARARTQVWQVAVGYSVALNVIALVVVPQLASLDRLLVN